MSVETMHTKIREMLSKIFGNKIPSEMLHHQGDWSDHTRHLAWLHDIKEINADSYAMIYAKSNWLLGPYASIIHKILIAKRKVK